MKGTMNHVLRVATILLGVADTAISTQIDDSDLHRNLMNCDEAALYNAAVNVYVKYRTSCSHTESQDIQAHLKGHFDDTVNADNEFKGKLKMVTNFCQDSRRLVTAETQEERQDFEAEEEKLLEGIKSLRNGTDYLVNDGLLDKDGHLMHRELTLKGYLVVRFVIRGNGRCLFFCNPDDKDHNSRRRLGTHPISVSDYFYRKSYDMEKLLNMELTKSLSAAYDMKSGHCLEGKEPFVRVHIVTHKHSSYLTNCWSQPSMHCCAPKRDPSNACSKMDFGSWYCHENEDRCRNCDGIWVNALDPPHNCLGLWAQCTGGKTCCSPYKCVYNNQWYSQCREG